MQYQKVIEQLGYSPREAKVYLASLRLGEAHISDIAEKVGINAEYVLKRLVEIDELDILDIMNDDLSGFKLLTDWPKAWRISINAMDIKKIITSIGDDNIETVIEKIKWPDKTRNLELIGKHVNVGAWEKEKSGDITVNNIMPVPTADSIEGWEVSAQAQQSEILNRND